MYFSNVLHTVLSTTYFAKSIFTCIFLIFLLVAHHIFIFSSSIQCNGITIRENVITEQPVAYYSRPSLGLCPRLDIEMSQIRDIFCVRQIHTLQEKITK